MSERLSDRFNDVLHQIGLSSKRGLTFGESEVLRVCWALEREAHDFYASRITERLLAAPQFLSYGAEVEDE